MKIQDLLENTNPADLLKEINRKMMELNRDYVKAQQMKSADWAQAIKSKLLGLAKQKMQVQKSLGIDEGWSDHHPDQDYDEYIERLRDAADAHRKEKKENPPQDKKDSDKEVKEALTPQQKKAHKHNVDAAQREIDRRHAEGEDMTGAKVDQKTYKIIKSKGQLAEGALDNLKSLLVKAQSLPSISQYMAAAKAKLPMIIAAAKGSSGGKDLLAKIAGRQTQEGLGGVMSGGALAGTGASLIAMVAELAMRVYISMGSPSYEQLSAQQGAGFLLLAAFATAGAGAMAIGASKAVDSARTQTEGGMPSSVIRYKQRNAEMTDREFAIAHKDKSDNDLFAMAWRHGYGKGSPYYVDKRKRGLVAEAATAGATSSGNIASLGQSPHVVLGRSRGQKSYTGSPGKSGTKAPAQPKPKKQTPKDNALNFKGGIIS